LHDAVTEIVRVRPEIDARGSFQRFEGRDGGHQLHAVVGRDGLAAGQLLAVRAGFEDCPPAARSRIPRAGTIRVDDHMRLGLCWHQRISRPYSLAEATD